MAEDWGEGYVVDVEYVDRFHAGFAPLDLAFAALLNGVAPPDPDRPFAYLDLGCGSGVTAALIAAAHPHGQVWGADFNPAHIQSARVTADAAGLANARFVEASFASLLDQALPEFDFVVAHGIWSWVSQANRDRIVALLARCVRPGGLVVVSYNCHPGWDALLPLRRLLFSARAVRGDGAGPLDRIDRALAMARELRDAGADYFRDTPAAGTLLDALTAADRAYVAHEFLNAEWTLFDPGQVAAAMALAGLRTVGSARLIDAFDDLWLTTEQQALLQAETDPSAASMLRDLILDRRFRLDLFVRGGEAVDAAATTTWHRERRFVLARPRSECSLTIRTRIGETTFPDTPALALLDALADGPATGATLSERPELAGIGLEAIGKSLALLVTSGNVRLALDEADEPARRRSTERFNAVALAAARMGDPAAALASPITGSGVSLSGAEQMMLDAVRIGIPIDAIAMGDDDETARFRDRTLASLEALGLV